LEIDVKVVAYCVGAIFAIFGCLMLFEGGRAVPVNEQLVSTGWLLAILAAAIWLITLIGKKL
jgi:membrane associated rhomboid family serine protease